MKPIIKETRFTGVHIQTEGDPALSEFYKKTKADLEKLATGHAGRTLINGIAAACTMHPERRVIITKAPKGEGSECYALSLDPTAGCAEATGDPFMPYVAGPGYPTVMVDYDANQGMRFDTRSALIEKHDPSLAYVTLGHELLHASRALLGTGYRPYLGEPRIDRDSGAAEEEIRTVGIGPYQDEYPSENAIRAEHGLVPRPDYDGNKGRQLRRPPEINSPHTIRRLRELGAKIRSDE
jgi:hypothetical protein